MLRNHSLILLLFGKIIMGPAVVIFILLSALFPKTSRYAGNVAFVVAIITGFLGSLY